MYTVLLLLSGALCVAVSCSLITRLLNCSKTSVRCSLKFTHCSVIVGFQSMENGLHYMAVAFAMQLVKLLLVDERSVSHVTEADLLHTIETLMRTCAHSRANAPEG